MLQQLKEQLLISCKSANKQSDYNQEVQIIIEINLNHFIYCKYSITLYIVYEANIVTDI